ncbi:MAG: phosphoenolpyruvate mutase, partial [Candidatus Limiplasma sp.]|nr:phosphoenolpyruvate mutase [Candidatus Limiplasma sp.]
VSSLCDSTVKGKPDIELVDLTSRIHTLEEIMEVTTKPIILDGDTGGLTEHFVYNLRTLERLGISAIIIEDKTGLKKNSLFGTDAQQVQAPIEEFCEKIRAGKKAQRSRDFMIFARCESLILDQGQEDALARCDAYVRAGADGVMIHSCKKTPDEVYAFMAAFRKLHPATPIVVVPTTYNGASEAELAEHGANIIIHANHLLRSAFPAMQKTAELTLQHGRTKEADQLCLSIKEILTLIPTED